MTEIPWPPYLARAAELLVKGWTASDLAAEVRASSKRTGKPKDQILRELRAIQEGPR